MAAVAAAAAILLIGCGGSQPEAPTSRPAGESTQAPAGPPSLNVLLITLDTTRADRLGCYGYGKAETPALDSLAKRGLRFENAFTHVPLTLPSHTSMLTGMRPPEHGLHDNGRGRLAEDVPVLQQILSDRGWRTAAFLASFVLDKQFGLARGFDVYDDRMQPAKRGDNLYDRENPANLVADRALKWLGEHAEEPFFCWAHFFDPHLPYAPPEPFKGRHADPYDGEIAFMDSQVKRLLDFLDARGLRGKTLIIAAGDHGEAFGEHAELGHGPLIYETTMRVPVIVSLPGRIEPGEVSDRVIGLAGLAPTVLALLGERAAPSMTAAAWMGEADGSAACYGESEFLLNGYGWAPLRSLTTHRWRYILCPKPELYDRGADPAEKTDLIGAQPQTAERLRTRLTALTAGMRKGRAVTVDIDPAALAALRALGYLGGPASRAVRVDPQNRRDPKAMMHVYKACLRAEHLALLEKHQDVIDLLAPLLAESPESIEIHEYLVASYMSLGQNGNARRHLEVCLTANPGDRTMIANLGTVLMDADKREEAIQILRQGLRLPRGPVEPVTKHGASKIELKLRTNLGICLTEMGRLEPAIAQYRLALKADPDHTEAHNNLANALNMQGHPEQAIPHYQAALKQRPDAPAILANYGVALSRMGRIGEAIAQYRRSLELRPDAADVHINLGDALMAIRQVEPALASYRKAVEVAPQDARPPFVLGRVLSRLDRGEEAIQAFEKALAVEPRSAAIHSNIAVIHTRAGRLKEAVARYRKALALDANATGVRNNLGICLCRMKQYAEAIKVWREGLKHAADDPLLQYNLAWWLATCPQADLRNGVDAVRFAEAVAKTTKRKDARVLDALAAAYAEAGRFADAATTSREAMIRAGVLGQTKLFREIEARGKLYAAGKPFHQSP